MRQNLLSWVLSSCSAPAETFTWTVGQLCEAVGRVPKTTKPPKE